MAAILLRYSQQAMVHSRAARRFHRRVRRRRIGAIYITINIPYLIRNSASL
jgi:hypothetical protein